MIIEFSKTNNEHNKFIYNSCLSILDFLEKNNEKINKILNSSDKEREDYFLSLLDAKNYKKFCLSYYPYPTLTFIETFLEIKQDLYIKEKNYLCKKNNILFFIFKILYFYNNNRFVTMIPVSVKMINNKFTYDFEKSRELLKKEYQNARKIVNKQKRREDEME